MRRTGVTLVEMLVAAALGMLLLGVLWGIFRSLHRAEHQLSSINGTTLEVAVLRDRLGWDLERAIAPTLSGGSPDSLDVRETRLALRVTESSSIQAVGNVTWAYDPVTRSIQRDGRVISVTGLVGARFALGSGGRSLELVLSMSAAAGERRLTFRLPPALRDLEGWQVHPEHQE